MCGTVATLTAGALLVLFLAHDRDRVAGTQSLCPLTEEGERAVATAELRNVSNRVNRSHAKRLKRGYR